MDMQSSRRSAPMDRSRDPGPGLKKPRLAEEAERDRSFPPPPRFSGGGRPTDPRIRASAPERDRESGRAEREEPGRGGSYEHQHLQELVAQYKTALAELTFNSKPIITNLTIIAGENLQAAKAIAATICANILEVPSEQKLPSLYLLDSIVKNIGRDYIKYFSTRLPEVFCKAYRQVDSSIHPGMRHLFGTWKGVFSLAPLQMIEKELGFPPIVNGSSRLTASKPDSQTRPSHSIHVNPKYLEARQRLQQSTRAQEINNDDTSSALSPVTSAERSDSSAAIGSERQWADLPMKFPNIQRLQREQLSNPVNEKKEHREHEFLSDLSQQSELGAPAMLTKEQDGPDKPWYGSSNAASESHYNTRNGLDVNHVYRNFRESGSTRANCHLSSVQMNNVNNSNQTVSKNWKNSEEEEYMWDDMNSRLADHGGTSSSIKGCQNTDDADRSATGGKWLPMNNKHQGSWWGRSDTYSEPKNSTMEDRVSFFEDIEEHIRQPHQEDIDLRINMEISTDLLSIGRTESGHCASSEWAPHEAPSSVVSLNHTSSTISGNSEGQCISFSSCLATSQCTSSTTSGLPSHSLPSSLGPLTNIVSGSRGTFGQHMPQPLRPASPSACLPPSSATRLHPKSHTSTDHDHLQSHSLSQMGQKPLQASVLLNKPPQASVNQDSFPILAYKQSQQSGSLLNLQKSQQSQLSAASTIVNELRHQLPILQQSQSDPLLQLPLSQSQPSIQAQKPPLLQLTVGSNQTGGFSGTSHVSSLTVDVPGQSSTDNLVAAIMKSGVVPNNLTQNQNVQPPLPSGPPPIHALLSSVPLVTHSSVSLPTSHGSAPSITSPSIRCVLPPLPPGPPPFSSMLGTTMQISNISSAISNPLSNLLSSLVEKGIINLSTELSSTTSAEKEAIPSNGSSVFASSIKVQVPSTSAALANSPRPLVKELSVLNSSTPVDIDLAESTYTGMEDLIGIDFRPEIVREFHPSVIDSLINDLKHQCITCGLRFKFQEQLQSHSDWHAAKSSKESSLGDMSRKWFVEIGNCVAKSVGEPYGLVCATPIEVVTPAGEKCESMVPADESQCICTLCGEPFEDFYSVERDEWMYKGAVYFELPDRQDETGVIDEIEELVPIIHTRCLSRSCDGMEVAENNQVD